MGQTRGSRVVTSVGQAVKCGYLSVLLLALALASGKVTAAKEFLEAGPQWSPQEVVAIQLDALQSNDEPTPNAGIEQVWKFAHPRNRAMTGPLSRFIRMVNGPGYRPLVGHRFREVREMRRDEDNAAYAVRVLAEDGGFYNFIWQLARVDLEPGRSWMTTQVAPGQRTGEQLSMETLDQAGLARLE